MITAWKTTFQIDSIPGIQFAGYTDGADWNGFACPYFDRSDAEHVLHASEQNGFSWSYDAGEDAFLVWNEQYPDEDPETFAGIVIDEGGSPSKVYPIGAYSWTWSECSSVQAPASS